MTPPSGIPSDGQPAVVGADRWAGMGSAGIRPRGDDRFNSCCEPWCDWRKLPSPGYLILYTYWMEMARDRDGHYWGNMLGPVDAERMVRVALSHRPRNQYPRQQYPRTIMTDGYQRPSCIRSSGARSTPSARRAS